VSALGQELGNLTAVPADAPSPAQTFATKREAKRFLAEIEASLSRGMYVDPHAGRLLFATHARQWLDSRNDELTTKARDASIMHHDDKLLAATDYAIVRNGQVQVLVEVKMDSKSFPSAGFYGHR
jgi:hypothetical protein